LLPDKRLHVLALYLLLHYSKLTADLQHLRQLLHEEKEAAAAALAGSSAAKPGLANASREELLHQLHVAAAAHAKERARNAELVHRLQQLHAEQVGECRAPETELVCQHFESLAA
jgi:uncharacterized protein YpiB (UPF0302 family)